MMKKSNYVTKLDTMIDEVITKGTNAETTDSMMKKLLRVQDFLYGTFHNNQCYRNMHPDSNQPVRLYGTAKTHKFQTLENISVVNLKLQIIIDETEMFTYIAAKVISGYLRPLCKNEYSINDTLKIPSMLSSIPLLQHDEEDVSYAIESLFIDIPIEKQSTISLNKYMFIES